MGSPGIMVDLARTVHRTLVHGAAMLRHSADRAG
jgi:hypothetical protein